MLSQNVAYQGLAVLKKNEIFFMSIRRVAYSVWICQNLFNDTLIYIYIHYTVWKLHLIKKIPLRHGSVYVITSFFTIFKSHLYHIKTVQKTSFRLGIHLYYESY